MSAAPLRLPQLNCSLHGTIVGKFGSARATTAGGSSSITPRADTGGGAPTPVAGHGAESRAFGRGLEGISFTRAWWVNWSRRSGLLLDVFQSCGPCEPAGETRRETSRPRALKCSDLAPGRIGVLTTNLAERNRTRFMLP